MSTTPRVLSIQSHVVHGYVGNKCAILPLNRLGFDVDAINSVQFSNHTGYPTFQGSVLNGDGVEALIAGLEANGLLTYTHILTGYIGSPSLLNTISSIVEKLRGLNPDIVYVCDPVQGDDRKLYCKPEMPELFRTSIMPIASIITPNQFEAELLSGMTILSENDALAVCDRLHMLGPHTVVITSLALADFAESVTIIASTVRPQAHTGHPIALRVRVPRIHAYFTGTGDLFTALLLAWMHRCPEDLKLALEYAVAALQTVLVDTVENCGEAVWKKERTAAVSRARELRIVQNQDVFSNPKVQFKAETI